MQLDDETRVWALSLMRAIPEASDDDVGDMLDELATIVKCPNVSDYMFYHRPHLSEEEVIEKALQYRPVALPAESP